jgi:mRNA-degrading endonuclease HigB of HigAB toxin-antitoxin module
MANRYPIREYKDNLFRVIFHEKKELLALYNALNHSNYDDPEQLEIVTLENVFFLKMKNDVAFLINTNDYSGAH